MFPSIMRALFPVNCSAVSESTTWVTSCLSISQPFYNRNKPRAPVRCVTVPLYARLGNSCKEKIWKADFPFQWQQAAVQRVPLSPRYFFSSPRDPSVVRNLFIGDYLLLLLLCLNIAAEHSSAFQLFDLQLQISRCENITVWKPG